MMAEIDYKKLAIKLAAKAVKVIKKEILDSSKKEESSKEKENGKSVEDSS